MKKKLFACVLLVLVVLQAVFVPVLADGVESGGVSSYRETTIFEDFGMDPGSTSSDFESEVIGGSFSSSEPYVWEILTSCFERSYSKTSFFLYVFNRGYSSMTDSFSVTLADEYGYLFTVSADVIDWTEHCAKICIDLVPSSSWIKTTSTEISIEVNAITCNGRSSRPYVEEYEVGEAKGNVGLVYSVSTGKLTKRFILETLDLNVTLMAERFSSGETPFQYAQLNTAAFIIPNSYFERFGDLAVVRYIYDLYSNVPMSVLENSDVVRYAVRQSGCFASSDFDFNFSPLPSYSPYSGYGVSFSLRYQEKFLWFNVAHQDFDILPFNRFFTFVVDDIINTGNGGYDFSSEEALARFQFIKNNFSPPYKDVLGAESFESFSEEITIDDSWSTVSLSDYLDTQSWVLRFAYSLGLHGTIVDDSISDVPAIQLITSDLNDLTDEEISDLLYVDPYYSSDLKDLYDLAESSDGQLVLLRFCLSSYFAFPCNRIKCPPLHDSWETVEGYVCCNSIIDNFRIISFDFRKLVQTEDGPTIITTTVPVNMSPVSFIDGGQSPDALQDEFVEKWPSFSLGIFSAAQSGFDWLKRIVAIVGVILIVVILIKLISFVVAAARFLQIRKRGSSDSDSPKRRKRHRKKRDRR